MFYYVSGKLAKLDPGLAVVDCGGVGYMCNISARTEQKLASEEGKPVKLYTYLSVREDAMDLFGFTDNEEINTFKLLISVSGVGAKTALGVLGSISPEKFALAVSTGDVKAIKAPGVGPKIAARIILELKDKVSKGTMTSYSDETSGVMEQSSVKGNKLIEARTALMALGFSRPEAEGFLRSIDCTNLTVEEIIRESLKKA